MTGKTVFFDIDGTLLAPRNGLRFQMPPSTLRALHLLKEKENRIVICSGRQEEFIHRFFPGLFDSYVAMNGTHIVFEGKTLLDRPFSAERIKKLMAHFDSFDCSYVFVGQHHGWTRRVPKSLYPYLNDSYGIPDFLVTEWSPEDVKANMMDFVFESDEDYEKRAAAFTDSMILNRHPGMLTSDLSFRDWNKAQGIMEFLRYTGISKKDTIAFGDGYNDIGMMGAVGCAIAMGNAMPEVKQAADYVTSAIFEDGIYNGLRHFGLI